MTNQTGFDASSAVFGDRDLLLTGHVRSGSVGLYRRWLLLLFLLLGELRLFVRLLLALLFESDFGVAGLESEFLEVFPLDRVRNDTLQFVLFEFKSRDGAVGGASKEDETVPRPVDKQERKKFVRMGCHSRF